MKRSIGRARSAALVLAVLGAVLATVGGAISGVQPTAGRICTAAAAVAVGVVPLVRPRWSGAVLRDWTRARSVSEALKTEIYLYLTGAGPYRYDGGQCVLRERTDEIREHGSDLLRHTRRIRPVPRALPEVDGVESYFRVRVGGQIDEYYRPQADVLGRRLSWFRRVEVALAAGAVVLGALAAGGVAGVGSWIAVVTTITAAVAAHVAAGRYEYQLIEYLRTADQLSRLRARAALTRSETELNDLVVESERIISIQNEGWMAKLGTDPTENQA